MWVQPSIGRKYNVSVWVDKSFDRIRDEIVYHKNIVVVCQREQATVEHPMNISGKSNAIPY
jgi:hypothetical protein